MDLLFGSDKGSGKVQAALTLDQSSLKASNQNPELLAIDYMGIPKQGVKVRSLILGGARARIRTRQNLVCGSVLFADKP